VADTAVNPTTTVTAATVPVIRALLDQARRKKFRAGVLGVRARPQWEGPDTFEHNGTDVWVRACPSALAVREALLDRAADRWLVLLTDRDETELGLGITAHLVWQRLRQPDPWSAVQDRFAATRIDHRLVASDNGRDVALGLLATTPPGGWPPAPAGLLIGDHVFTSVATLLLQVSPPGEPLDLTAILRWTTRVESATAVADLRAIGGDALVDALLAWLAGRCGAGGEPVGRLLRDGRATDVVPLGLVARAIVSAGRGSGPRALLGREIGGNPGDHALLAWAAEAEAVAREILATDPDAAARVLARAETLVDQLEADALAGESTVLRRGLIARLAAVGEALRRCADRAAARVAAGGPDGPLIDAALLPEIEERRAAVQEHALAGRPDEIRVPPALAAVRLARWLAQPVPIAADLSDHVARYRDQDAWVDRAVADAWTGIDDEALTHGLRAALGAVRLRRDAHDTAFASALASATQPPVGFVYQEGLLASTVTPLAKQQPVLLVIVDGMSQPVASVIVDDVVRRYETWLECLPASRDGRLAAIAALPTLTQVCRASLLCGELTVGEHVMERTGFDRLIKAHRITGALIDRLWLEDSDDSGLALAPEVRAAIDDVTGTRLVTCVLNTIRNALDRPEAGGSDWAAETVKNLRPLLDRARRAGRVVVLASDHGHVAELRDGRLVSVGSSFSDRSRPFADDSPPGDGEVRVRGPRVLLHGGDAVLAVDTRLRYGPLKAGYHGGAAPAEVVVPVVVLAPGEAPEGWRLAPPQSPGWWRNPVAESQAVVSTPRSPSRHGARGGEPPTLFDTVEPDRNDLANAVLASAAYRDQRHRGARLRITDDQIRKLLAALLAAPDHRLDPESAAVALGVAAVQLAGALTQAQRLLNIEQYPILSRDADGATVVLDVGLLREQFWVIG